MARKTKLDKFIETLDALGKQHPHSKFFYMSEVCVAGNNRSFFNDDKILDWIMQEGRHVYVCVNRHETPDGFMMTRRPAPINPHFTGDDETSNANPLRWWWKREELR